VKRSIVTLMLMLFGACGGGGGGGEPDAGAVPPRLSGDATGGDMQGEWVECTFFVDFGELVPTETGWTGVALGGEVFRRSWDGEAPVFEFQALVAGEVTVTDLGGGQVEVRGFGDQPDDAMPFWLELEVLTGTGTEGDWTGSWTCAPILPDTPAEDHDLEVVGTWTLTAAS
jgi:hypothetical protein